MKLGTWAYMLPAYGCRRACHRVRQQFDNSSIHTERNLNEACRRRIVHICDNAAGITNGVTPSTAAQQPLCLALRSVSDCEIEGVRTEAGTNRRGTVVASNVDNHQHPWAQLGTARMSHRELPIVHRQAPADKN